MAVEKDDISLKDLIAGTKGWIRYLIGSWKKILIVGIIGAALGTVYAIYAKPKYEAQLVFVLSNGGNSSGLAGLAGQLGLNLTGGGGEDAFQGDNIIELFKSKNILKRALFKPLPDSSNLLINLFAEKTGLAEGWQKSERLHAYFPFPQSGRSVLGVQDSLFREAHALVLKKYLSVEKIDKKLNFYKVSVASVDENLSVALVRNIVDEATSFYIETKTKTSRENLEAIQHEADSLRYLLGGAINSAASAADETFNLNAALQASRTAVQKNQIQAQVLGTAYGEVVKNLEIAKITLKNSTPLFQIIDMPQFPLKMQEKSKVVFFIVGGFLGAFLAICWLTTVKLYQKLYKI